ncbi:MAG: DNA repair protein RadC [bacterium]
MEEKVKYTIKNLPANEQPREKLIEMGSDVLSNAELLAVILGTGYKNEGVLELANRILSEYGSKAITKIRSVERLMNELSIPKVKACQLISCFEIGRRFFAEDTARMPTLRGPEDVYKYLGSEMAGLKKENFHSLCLNTRNKLIHDEVVSVGTLDASIVHPREVFGPAIEFSSAGVILVHNHPSGDPEPSVADKELTTQLIKAGKILGIEILDHVVVGKDGFFSFSKEGELGF